MDLFEGLPEASECTNDERHRYGAMALVQAMAGQQPHFYLPKDFGRFAFTQSVYCKDVVKLACVFHLFLSLYETPPVLEGIAKENPDIIGKEGYWADAIYGEVVVIIIYFTYNMLCASVKKTFHFKPFKVNDQQNAILLGTNLVQFLALGMMSAGYSRWPFLLLRPVIILLLSERLTFFFDACVNTFLPLLKTFVFLIGAVIFYSIVGLNLFSEPMSEKEVFGYACLGLSGTTNPFGNIGMSFVTMYTMATSDNFPAIIWPYLTCKCRFDPYNTQNASGYNPAALQSLADEYGCMVDTNGTKPGIVCEMTTSCTMRQWTATFFYGSFMFTIFFCLSNIVLAICYTLFERISRESLTKRSVRTRCCMVTSFHILADPTTNKITETDFMSTLHYVASAKGKQMKRLARFAWDSITRDDVLQSVVCNLLIKCLGAAKFTEDKSLATMSKPQIDTLTEQLEYMCIKHGCHGASTKYLPLLADSCVKNAVALAKKLELQREETEKARRYEHHLKSFGDPKKLAKLTAKCNQLATESVMKFLELESKKADQLGVDLSKWFLMPDLMTLTVRMHSKEHNNGCYLNWKDSSFKKQLYIFLEKDSPIVPGMSLFDTCMLCLVLTNACLASMESTRGEFQAQYSDVTTVVFFFEMVLKLAAYGVNSYWIDSWNRFDFVITWLSVIALIISQMSSGEKGLMSLLPCFRMMRILRVWGILGRQTSSLYGRLVSALATTVPICIDALIVVGLFMYEYMVLGIILMGKDSSVNTRSIQLETGTLDYVYQDPYRYDWSDMPSAFWSAMTIMVENMWSLYMTNAMDFSSAGFKICIYFLLGHFVAVFLMLNIIQSLFVFAFSTLMESDNLIGTWEHTVREYLEQLKGSTSYRIKKMERLGKLEHLLCAFDNLEEAFTEWQHKKRNPPKPKRRMFGRRSADDSDEEQEEKVDHATELFGVAGPTSQVDAAWSQDRVKITLDSSSESDREPTDVESESDDEEERNRPRGNRARSKSREKGKDWEEKPRRSSKERKRSGSKDRKRKSKRQT